MIDMAKEKQVSTTSKVLLAVVGVALILSLLGGLLGALVFDTPGPQGEQGVQGIQGIQGKQGIQGVDGKQGPPGKPGKDGAVGQPGRAGVDLIKTPKKRKVAETLN